jgi:hypothetical protein
MRSKTVRIYASDIEAWLHNIKVNDPYRQLAHVTDKERYNNPCLVEYYLKDTYPDAVNVRFGRRRGSVVFDGDQEDFNVIGSDGVESITRRYDQLRGARTYAKGLYEELFCVPYN